MPTINLKNTKIRLSQIRKLGLTNEIMIYEIIPYHTEVFYLSHSFTYHTKKLKSKKKIIV